MKLIFVNRFFFPDHSATSQILTDLATDLAKDGREVHVVTSRQLYDDPAAMLTAEEESLGIHVHRIWTTRFGRANLAGRAIDYATFYLSAAVELLRLAGNDDVIVAKTDPPLISVIAAWVARRRGAILVNWIQDVFPEVAQRLGVKAMQGPSGMIARRLRDYSLRAARANVVLGDRMAAYIGSAVPDTGVPVTVIENWSDGRLVRPVSREQNALRQSWRLGDAFVVGYSGNMGRAHEFQTILTACELTREDRDIVYLFIGAGRQKEWIEKEAADRGFGNIDFRPYQPREMLAQSLSAADVHLVTLQPALEGLIVPSKYYGIGAAGRPTIFIGDLDGEIARAILRDGCGHSIATGDSKGLANIIRAMKADLGATARMGARAREAFERRNDRPVAHARWVDLLGNITDATRG